MRYIIFNGSISHHCCFEFSVLDTKRPVIIDGEHKEDENGKHYEAVCECFYRGDATRICALLNTSGVEQA